VLYLPSVFYVIRCVERRAVCVHAWVLQCHEVVN